MKPDLAQQSFNFDTKILRYLLGIVEEGSLSKAAEKFYISQPALSRYLKRVEDALEVELFVHVNNHLEPTNAGKVFLNGARSMLYIEETALQEIANTHKREHHLEIWTEDFFCSALQETILPLFQQTYPDIILQLHLGTASDIHQNLINGTADFGLFWGNEIESPFFTCNSLFGSNMVYCLPTIDPDHPPILSGRSNYRIPSDVQFLMTRKTSYMRHMQELILEEHRIHTPQIGGELSLPLLKELLCSGYGHTILPRLLAEAWIEPERILPLLPIHTCYALLGEYQGHVISDATVLFKQLISEHIVEAFPFL